MSDGDRLLHLLVTRAGAGVVDYALMALRLMTEYEHPEMQMLWQRRGRIRRSVSARYTVTVRIRPKGPATVEVERHLGRQHTVEIVQLPDRYVRTLQKTAMSAEDVEAAWNYLDQHLPFRRQLASGKYEYRPASMAYRLPPPARLLRPRSPPRRRPRSPPRSRSPRPRSPPRPCQDILELCRPGESGHKCYLRLARDAHPDRGGDTAKFQKLEACKDLLKEIPSMP